MVKKHSRTAGVKNKSKWHSNGGRDRRSGKLLAALTVDFVTKNSQSVDSTNI